LRSRKASKVSGEVVALSPREDADIELVEGMLYGDPAAASAFYHRYGARISRWVWRLLGADEDHDDMVNQVFVNIMSSIGGLRNVGSLGSWVDSVVFRRVRKELRRRKLKRLLVPSTPRIEASVDAAHPNKEVAIMRFYEVLERMPIDDQMVFVLRYLEERPLAEVASAGGYSLATAKRRLEKARRKFAQLASRDPILVTLL